MMRKSLLIRAIAAIAVLVGFSAAVRAQPLADRVPADAKLYLGWAGSAHLGEAYDQSHLRAVLAQSGLPELAGPMLERLIQRIPERESRQQVERRVDLGRLMLRHPAAFYLTHVTPEVDPRTGQSPIHLAIVCQAGEDTGELENKLRPLVNQALQDNAPIALVRMDDLLVLLLGKPTLPVGAGGNALTRQPQFRRSMSDLPSDAVLAMHANLGELWGMIDHLVKLDASDREYDQWQQVRQTLNLDGIRSATLTAGFADRDWQTAAFVHAPAPRKGLAMLFDGEPLSKQAYRLVPATAAMAGGGGLDLAAIYDAIYDGLGRMQPQVQAQIDTAAARFREQMGFDVRNDLLQGLGREWVYMVDRDIAGTGPAGMVLVNRLRDADKAAMAIERTLGLANAIIQQQTRNEEFQLSIRTVQRHGVRMHYLAAPLISPTLAITEGRLYLGLFPHAVDGAIARHRKGGPSILDNRGFVELRRQLGADRAAGFDYVDVPQLVGNTYAWMAMLDRMVGGLADMAGAEGPTMLLPALTTLREHVKPIATFAWSDEQGWHTRHRSPFPGAAMLGMGQDMNMTVATTAVMAGITLPAITRARELAHRTQSASNAAGIAKAAFLYAADHSGRLPDSLGELVKDGYVDADLFVNPRHGDSPPAFRSTEEAAKWVEQNSDYVYLGAGRKWDELGGDADVIVYANPAGLGEAIAIGFGDGHVEVVEMSGARRLIDKARKRAQQAD